MPTEFLEIVLREPEIGGIDGLLFNQGHACGTFGATFLLSALIEHALDTGVEEAVSAMYKFLEADRNRCIEVVLLEGISVSTTVEIAKGIFLCPLNAVPSSTLRAYLTHLAEEKHQPGHLLGQLLHDELHKPSAALFEIREAKPKFYSEIPKLQPRSDFEPIYDVVNVLAIMGPTSPHAFKSFIELADGEFLKGHVGFTWGIQREETRVYKNVGVTGAEIESFVPLIRQYLALPAEMKLRLRIPLHRLNEAVRHSKLEDRALDLGIALESLLLGGDPGKEKITLRLKRRGASLLAAEKSQGIGAEVQRPLRFQVTRRSRR